MARNSSCDCRVPTIAIPRQAESHMGSQGLSQVPEHGISFREALNVWLRVAALSFGGPAGQIAVMHRILVEEKRWVSESRFLHALNYSMVLPDVFLTDS